MIQPVVLDLFWNEDLNGGKVEDVVQVVDATAYHWNCYSCMGTYIMSIPDFLTEMRKSPVSQLNNRACYLCNHSKSYSDFHVLNLISKNQELSDFVTKEYENYHSELEVITHCPICGKLHSVKLRSIKRNRSFVCSECVHKYGEKKFQLGTPISEIKPFIGPDWGESNKYDFENTYPLLYFQPFNLNCPNCGKNHTKSLDAIIRSGSLCDGCARIKTVLEKGNSLRDKYPVIADMWDGGNNSLESFEVPASSSKEGKFLCNQGIKPHTFIRPVYQVISSYKGGSCGCPVCSNKELYTGVNDFATRFPNCVKYWDYENNNNTPEKTICTNLSFYALICPRCGKKHSKRTDAVERNGAYCEQCSISLSKVTLNGSLRELYPSIADMWDKGGNSIKSDAISVGSNLEGYFLCTGKDGTVKPHKFHKSVSAMVAAAKKGNLGCPVCAGFKVVQGINDFKFRNPEIAACWDYKNNLEKPEDVYYRSEKSYNFVCKKGHPFRKDPLHLMRSIGTSSLGCPVCHGKQIIVGDNDLASVRPDLLEQWDFELNLDISPYEVTVASNKLAWFHCKACGTPYQTSISNWVNNMVVSCEDCRKRNWSFAEKELIEKIRSWGIDVKENTRILGGKYILDAYIPSKGIAIEYNGLYWHSTYVNNDKNYHYNKYDACKNLGIQLIFVWEDDYRDKPQIVERMLKAKLGISTEKKVNARDCDLYWEEYSDARDFLNKNHIQGEISGSLYISLRTKDTEELVALAVLQKQDNNILLLKRYCTKYNVRGGFSKIIDYIVNHMNFSGIETFSDNCISDGNLYKENGFKESYSLSPDYCYLVNNTRVHKFNYRKSRFEKDPDLLYREGLSELELANLNNIPRIYDAGKVKWLLPLE